MNTPSETAAPAPPTYHFTQEELQKSLARRRQQPAAASGVKFRRNRTKWVALLLAEREKAKEAKNTDLAEALEAGISLMGHKFRRPISPGGQASKNSGMGGSGRPPGDVKKGQDTKKGNSEFSGEFEELITSRPDLADALANIARTKQQPKVARIAAMRKLIKETPVPNAENPADENTTPPAE